MYGSTFGEFYSYADNNNQSYINYISIGRGSTGAVASLDVLEATAYVGTPILKHIVPPFQTNCGKVGDPAKTANTGYLSGFIPYPNPTDNGLYLSPIWLHHTTKLLGHMRGFYQICHTPSSFVNGQEFSGSGAYSNKTFRVIKPTQNGGMYCMETSDTLDTNI